MYKEFVTYPLALKLMELGFDEECIAYFVVKFSGTPLRFIWEENEMPLRNSQRSSVLFFDITAPLNQQALRWFRNNHNLEVSISNYYLNNKKFKPEYQIYINGQQQSIESSCSSRVELYSTYEEAEHVAINKLIEIVINNKQNGK